jgi:anti-sigma factor RsiW
MVLSESECLAVLAATEACPRCPPVLREWAKQAYERAARSPTIHAEVPDGPGLAAALRWCADNSDRLPAWCAGQLAAVDLGDLIRRAADPAAGPAG